MKKNLLIILIFCTLGAVAQTGKISGRVVDRSDNEPLVGASVIVQGTTIGAISDVNGNFTINSAPSSPLTLLVNFVGYGEQKISVDASSGNVSLDDIVLITEAVGLAEVMVIASMAVDRKTPVAVSTVKAIDINEKVGNQEFPEILKNTPSIYVTKQGGGFGDSRINVRGFDQRNTAVMINGIPVNDMENGWVYWSNWAGLTDVASAVQVQRGLGASKLAVASVGGSINIVTNAAESKQGGHVSFDYGNDRYMKYGLAYNSGLMDNGLAVSVLATHTQGDGYVDGTMFRAYSYFLSMSKVFNTKHTINLTAVGAPQWHNQREFGAFDGVNISTLNELGTKYNPQWGTYAESDVRNNEFSWRKNFYHKPKIFLNHYWTISDKTDISTSVYASLGRGGGTGDLGRINGSFRTSPQFKDENGVRFNDIHTWNSGGSVPDFGADAQPWEGPGGANPGYNGPFAGQQVAESGRNGFIRRSSMNEHNWFGLLTNITHQFNDKLTLVTGLDARYYRGLHYRRVEDLMGLDAYYDDDDRNNPEHYVTAEGRASGNEIDYNNDGLVNWLGIFGQLEYSVKKFSTFLSLSGSNQGFKRVDYFEYLDSDPEQESDWQNFLGGTAKAGVNYNINDRHNVFVNGGYFSKQPIFDNVFLNFRNDINTEVTNQDVVSFEMGYGYRSSQFSANLNLYHTKWGNRQLSQSLEIEVDDNGTPIITDGNANFAGINQLHQGIEVDFIYAPFSGIEFTGMVSLGNWRYTDDFTATIVPEDPAFSDQTEQVTLFMKDVKVADAAQTTFSLGVSYEVIRGLKPYARFYYAANLYADYDLTTESAFFSPGSQAWELPAYSLLDLGLSYKFKLAGADVTWTANINNVLNKEYMSESESNILFGTGNNPAEDVEQGDNGSIENRVYHGFGLTWNTGLRVYF